MGKIGRAIRTSIRWKEDEKFRSKEYKRHKKYYIKHKVELQAKARAYMEELKRFANKRCKTCGTLLCIENRRGYCKEHKKALQEKTIIS